MKLRIASHLLAACLALVAFGNFAPAAAATVDAFVPAVLMQKSGWIATKSDNICGISDTKKVSNPAKVDYDDLWDATPQIKEMKKKNIDPKSPEGIALRKAAERLITKSCQEVRKKKGNCSVWKKIKHSDGRKVSDITAEVKKKF